MIEQKIEEKENQIVKVQEEQDQAKENDIEEEDIDLGFDLDVLGRPSIVKRTERVKQNDPALTVVDFSYQQFSMDEALALGKALENNTIVTKLILDHCELGKNAGFFIDVLFKNNTIQHMSLIDNQVSSCSYCLSDRGCELSDDNHIIMKRFCQRLYTAVTLNSALQVLDLRDNEFSTEVIGGFLEKFLVHNKTLRTLRYSIGFTGCQENLERHDYLLADALKYNATLQELHIEGICSSPYICEGGELPPQESIVRYFVKTEVLLARNRVLQYYTPGCFIDECLSRELRGLLFSMELVQYCLDNRDEAGLIYRFIKGVLESGDSYNKTEIESHLVQQLTQNDLQNVDVNRKEQILRNISYCEHFLWKSKEYLVEQQENIDFKEHLKENEFVPWQSCIADVGRGIKEISDCCSCVMM